MIVFCRGKKSSATKILESIHTKNYQTKKTNPFPPISNTPYWRSIRDDAYLSPTNQQRSKTSPTPTAIMHSNHSGANRRLLQQRGNNGSRNHRHRLYGGVGGSSSFGHKDSAARSAHGCVFIFFLLFTKCVGWVQIAGFFVLQTAN